MEVGQHREGTVVILEPEGKLDSHAAQELLELVLGMLNEGQRRVVLDMVKTEHIGGAGLRVLLMLTKKLDGVGGKLILCSMKETVRRAFDVAGFTRRFRIAATRAEALAELAGDEEVSKVTNLAAELLGLGGEDGESS